MNQTIGNQIVVQPDATVIDFFTEILNFRNDDLDGQFDLNLSLKRSPDQGETWLPRGRPIRTNDIFGIGALTPDDQIPVRDGAGLFDVAVNPHDGTLYAVWQDARFNGVDEVAFSMSTDGGFTWSEPVKINQTPTNAAEPLRQQASLPYGWRPTESISWPSSRSRPSPTRQTGSSGESRPEAGSTHASPREILMAQCAGARRRTRV